MIAAHVQQLHLVPRRTDGEPRSLRAFVWRAVTRMRQALCGLGGHSMMLHFEADRLSLRCFVCGARSPGWQLDVKPEFRRRWNIRSGTLRRVA